MSCAAAENGQGSMRRGRGGEKKRNCGKMGNCGKRRNYDRGNFCKGRGTAGKEIIGGEKTVGTGRRAAAGYSKPGILPGKTGMKRQKIHECAYNWLLLSRLRGPSKPDGVGSCL